MEFHLVPASKQTALSVWHMPVAVCTVLNSCRWTERPSETCTVSFQNKIILYNGASGWFYYRNILRCTALWTLKKSHLKAATICPLCPQQTTLSPQPQNSTWKWTPYFSLTMLCQQWHIASKGTNIIYYRVRGTAQNQEILQILYVHFWNMNRTMSFPPFISAFGSVRLHGEI